MEDGRASQSATGGNEGTNNAIYRLVESWWGEELTHDLAGRIAKAPRSHLAQFFDDSLDEEVLERHDQLDSTLASELPPPIKPGQTRLEARVLDASPPDWRCLQALLFSHEALVVPPSLAEQVWVIAEAEDSPANRRSLETTLRNLSDIRPLVDDGVVHFTCSYRMADLELLAEALRAARAEFPVADRESSARLAEQAELALRLPGRVMPLARTRQEFRQLSAVLSSIRGSHLEAPDHRSTPVRQLVTARVPALESRLDLIVRLRQSDEVFHEWRVALQRALEVARRRETATGETTDHAVLVEELRPITLRMETEIRKSSFLSRLRVGSTDLLWGSTFSLPIATATGTPLTAAAAQLLGTGAAMTARSAADAFRKGSAKGAQRAVIDIVGAFQAKGD